MNTHRTAHYIPIALFLAVCLLACNPANLKADNWYGVTGLAHIAVFTKDIDTSINFYRDNLGFEEIYRTTLESENLEIALVQRGTFILEFLQPDDLTTVNEGVDGIVNHIAFEVKGVDKLAADLQAKGIQFESGVFELDSLMNGVKGAFIRGPSGERIELFECLDPDYAMLSAKGAFYGNMSVLPGLHQGPSVDFSHGDLKISDNNRFIVHEDGTPFFYLGDTAWEIFHRLTREEAELYLENRRQKGFTVIQAVALAEFDGLNTPNAYGDRPLVDNDPARPDVTPGSNPGNDREYDYWDHVDWIIKKAAEKGIYIGLLPTWGDKVYPKWGIGPQVFTAENARIYGEWIGRRYNDSPNIIWINGGDRAPEDEGQDFKPVWRALAEGIKSIDSRHLMTYHPWGESSSSNWFRNDNWLDFNMLQSGHAGRDKENYTLLAVDYARTPVKPCIDGEPCYEDHAVDWDPNNGYFDEFDVRKAVYRGIFAGGHGTTYGCHPIWQMFDKGRNPITSARHYWYQALDMPGAYQMLNLRRLIESRPMLSRVPDQSLIDGDAGTGAEHLQATRGDGYAFIYLPTGRNLSVRMGKISGTTVKAWWFDPKIGASRLIGEFPNTGTREFDPPGDPRPGNDWVLVLDDAGKNYAMP